MTSVNFRNIFRESGGDCPADVFDRESAGNILKQGAARVQDILFPRVCPICMKLLLPQEQYVCEDCKKKLPWLHVPGQPLCKKCGKPISDASRAYCLDCMRRKHFFIEGECTFLYEGGFRDSLMRMKFQNHREYIPFYGAAMAAAHQSFLQRIRPAQIVPVPMNEKKRRARGFDQCLLLGQDLSQQTGIRVSDRSLIRVRYTQAQKGLNLRQREKNLQGAFALCEPDEMEEPVLLLDDIYTTGTTMDTISRLLRSYGITQIYFLALCTGRGRELKPLRLGGGSPANP